MTASIEEDLILEVIQSSLCGFRSHSLIPIKENNKISNIG